MFAKEEKPLYLVTGSDGSHHRSLVQMLRSVALVEPKTPVVVYDLGLSPEHRRLVHAAMAPLDSRMERFPFEDYPDWFDIRVEAGHFAWKPTILALEAAKSDAPLCWMDAGNVIKRPLTTVRREVRRRGFYSPPSSGSIAEWTHPAVLEYFGLPPGWRGDSINLTGGFVAFDPGRPEALRLLQDWARNAAIRAAIAPPGSNRNNHRQDQTLLTVLAYRSGIIREPSPGRGFWGREVLTHQDVD